MDGSAYRWFNRLADRTPWAHGMVVAYAKYGIGIFAVLLLATWLVSRRRSDAATALAALVWGGVAALGSLALNQVVGHAVARPRPYIAMPTAHLLVSRTGDFSFPSDHAAVAAAVTVGLWLVDRRAGLVAGLLALAMACARVYAGAHYPGDVLGGLLVGSLVAAAGWIPARRLIVPVAERGLSSVRELVQTRRT
ncbi:MAG TPA: phosphatase PAP2 family protein [Actinomycetota bacterium]|nr:phosphatase PAP2 family protein [Actinomycetota bacterium]